MFLPTTKEELKKLGWNKPDIILISGDTYIDSPFNGSAVIGKILVSKGYKVAIIAQPDINSEKDITRLGEPALFWGISAGCVDSMVANYTALQKKRRSDDFTPGGINNRRPDRAVLAYTNLVRRYFKNTVPVVIGGIEASLRRIAHYDYWTDSVRRSILFDAKADLILYGMSEKSVLELAACLKEKTDYSSVRGLCYISKTPVDKYEELPAFEIVQKDKDAFSKMFKVFYENNDPVNASGLIQKHGDRYLVQNPPAFYPTVTELDEFYNIPYERDVHPFYKKDGKVKALDTIKFSVISHFGCYGECNFCAIAVHQGRTIRSRSISSIKSEVTALTKLKDFRGTISDIGGPTANMYGFDCDKKIHKGSCKDRRCLFPSKCKKMEVNHLPLITLLKEIRDIKGIKNVFVGSGLRYDLIFEDQRYGLKYFDDIVNYHVSGQMKIAPEHTENEVLNLMGKPDNKKLTKFREIFYELSKKHKKNQHLTYYFIAAHPGCKETNMLSLKKYINENLKLNPEQVQIFTPTPATYSSLMYHTEKDIFNNRKLFVEKKNNKKEDQKQIVIQETDRRKF